MSTELKKEIANYFTAFCSAAILVLVSVIGWFFINFTQTVTSNQQQLLTELHEIQKSISDSDKLVSGNCADIANLKKFKDDTEALNNVMIGEIAQAKLLLSLKHQKPFYEK